MFLGHRQLASGSGYFISIKLDVFFQTNELLILNAFSFELFFLKMTNDKKNPHQSERNGNGHDDANTHENRMIHSIIMDKNYRC